MDGDYQNLLHNSNESFGWDVLDDFIYNLDQIATDCYLSVH